VKLSELLEILITDYGTDAEKANKSEIKSLFKSLVGNTQVPDMVANKVIKAGDAIKDMAVQ